MLGKMLMEESRVKVTVLTWKRRLTSLLNKNIWNPDHLAKTCTYMVYTCQRHPCPMLGDRHVADMFVNFTICVDMYIPNPKITNIS